MLNANAQAWVKALRSGQYKQTKRMLANAEGYCCLGVACEVYLDATNGRGLKVRECKDACGNVSQIRYNGNDVTLPIPVKDWLGLNDSDGGYWDGKVMTLVTLNDDRDYNFKQIADVIESEPEGLFIEGEKE
jgi:hypothetical protein